MNDLKYAIPASLFFGAFAVLLFVYGGPMERVLMLWTLFIGGLAQFVAQDNSIVARVTAYFMCWVAVILSFVAMISFMVGV